MLFVKIFPARWKYLKDNKNKNYFRVGKIGHMKSGFPIRKSKDKMVRFETPWKRLTVNDVLFSLKGLVPAVWPSM